jgi:hypothetical protein
VKALTQHFLNDKICSLKNIIDHSAVWSVPLQLSFAILCVLLRIGTADFTLHRFTDRTIGHAIVNGIDPQIRKSLYFQSIIIFCIAIALSCIIVYLIEQYLAKKEFIKHFELEKALFFEIGLLLLVNSIICFFYVIRRTQNEWVFRIIILLTVVIVVLAIHACLKLSKISRTSVTVTDSINNPLILFASVVLPIPFAYLVVFFLSIGASATINIYSLRTLFIYIPLYLAIRWILFSVERQKAEKIFWASTPLFFVPAALILSNEIQYTLSKQYFFSPKVIAVYFCVALIVISGICYFRTKTTPCFDRIQRRTENLIIPVILATMGLYTYHAQFLHTSIANLLDGEGGTVVAYQFLKFGQLPWLDIWPIHYLPVGSVIYGLFNGFNQMEVVLGGNLFLGLFNALIIYFSAKTILPLRWIVLLLLFSPFIAFSGVYYISALLPLLYIKTMWEKRRCMDYVMFLLLSLIAFMWMSSAGKISVISALVLVALSCSSKKAFFNIVKALLLVFGIPVILYSALTLIQGESLIDKLILIKAFAGEFDYGSYTSISHEGNSIFEIVLCYGLLPLISIITIIYGVLNIRKNNASRILVFVAVALLVAFIRGLARHSLMEGVQIYFFLLLLFMIPFGIEKIKPGVMKIISACMLAFFMLVPPLAQIGGGPGGLALGIRDFAFHQYQIGEKRYIQNDTEYPHNLKKLLDAVLTDGQTFFEIINGHLLYTLTERKVPFLHSSVQIIYSEPAQDVYIRQLKEKLKQNLVPLVIFDSANYLGDEIDGIPTEFSLYKLAEFIYQNYEPWIRAEGYHIWKAKNSGIFLSDVENTIKSIELSDKDTAYTTNDLEIVQNDNVLSMRCGITDPIISGFLRNRAISNSQPENCELKIVCRSSVAGYLQTFYFFNEYNEIDSTGIEIIESDDYRTYYLPIPKRNDNVPLTELRIDPPNGSLFEIKQLDIVNREIEFNYEPYIQQNWNLIKLPYIWANYDDKIVKDFPETVLELAQEITVEEEMFLPISSGFDKDDGNYLYFEIDSATDETLSISYGKDIVNTFDFNVLKGNHRYLVRISSQYDWMNSKQTMIKIKTSAPMFIKRISILQGD